MRILSFALALTVATQLVACGDDPTPTQVAQQPVTVQPQVQQPQVVVVEQGGNDTSAGEAMLIGAAAGAVAGHLASSTSHTNSSSPQVVNNHHYHTKTVVKTKYVNRPEKLKYVKSSKFSASKSKVSTKKPVKLTKS